jgi:hypothetical protein
MLSFFCPMAGTFILNETLKQAFFASKNERSQKQAMKNCMKRHGKDFEEVFEILRGRRIFNINAQDKDGNGVIDVIEGILNKENNVRHYERYIVSSGGFTAWGYKNKYGSIDKLGLEFIVADWDVERD